MKIYTTICGKNSLLGGVLIISLSFYNDQLPNAITKICKQIIDTKEFRLLNYISKIFNYSDYFYYEYSYIPDYYGNIQDLVLWRDTAQRLSLNLKYKLNINNPEIIFYKDIPSSKDFKVSYSKNLRKNLPLYLAQSLGKYFRHYELVKLTYRYPKYRLLEHKGQPSKKHFLDIMNYGICPMHRKDTLDLTAKFIQTRINKYGDKDMLHFQSYFKKLPPWWRVASGKYCLKDYFTKEELEEIFKNLSLCRRYKNAEDKTRQLYLPLAKLPPKFKKWVENNQC